MGLQGEAQTRRKIHGLEGGFNFVTWCVSLNAQGPRGLLGPRGSAGPGGQRVSAHNPLIFILLISCVPAL